MWYKGMLPHIFPFHGAHNLFAYCSKLTNQLSDKAILRRYSTDIGWTGIVIILSLNGQFHTNVFYFSMTAADYLFAYCSKLTNQLSDKAILRRYSTDIGWTGIVIILSLNGQFRTNVFYFSMTAADYLFFRAGRFKVAAWSSRIHRLTAGPPVRLLTMTNLLRQVRLW